MPPSDTEEADAAHRRFLSVGQLMTDSKPNEMFDGMRKTDDEENENSIGIIVASSSTPLNFENPDYGSTVLDFTKSQAQDVTGQSTSMKSPPFKEEQFGFDFKFVKRFFHLHGLLFFSLCSFSTVLFVFLLCLVLLRTYKHPHLSISLLV